MPRARKVSVAEPVEAPAHTVAEPVEAPTQPASTNLDLMDPAANYLRAELLPRRVHGWRKLQRYSMMAVELLSGEFPTNVDLVVYRRDTGSEVMRTPADVGSPDILLDQVNADLKSKTVTEFLAEWRLEA